MDNNHPEIIADDRISVIELNGIWFGIDILKSREVIPIPSITPVPNTEDFVIGVFNLRGDIFSLLDISSILGMMPKSLTSNDMVIVLDYKKITLGILSDRIHGVRSLNSTNIKQAHGVVSKKMAEFVTGIFYDKSTEIYLLDLDRLFASQAIRTYY